MKLDDPALLAQLGLIREQHAVYITEADNLQVTTWNVSIGATSVSITGRFLGVDGRIVDLAETHTPNTDRTSKSTIHALGEGWLLNLNIASNGAPLIGQIFVRASIVRGFSGSLTPIRILAQGFCNAAQYLSWPGSPIVTSTGSPGIIREVSGTNPAAGSEIAEQVPAGARWRLLSFMASLVTDATVATRVVALQLTHNANTWARVRASATQAASLTVQYYGAAIGYSSAAAANDASFAIPQNHILLSGATISTFTSNLAAGDDWNAPTMLVEEWLEATA